MGLVSWDVFRPRRDDHDNRAKSSSIIHLSLPATVASGLDLAEVLSWPKALQSLRIEDFSHESSAHECHKDSGDWGLTIPSGVEIVDALQSQREYLEELSLGGRWTPSIEATAPGINLTILPQIRRLRIPQELVMLLEEGQEVDSSERDESLPTISAILPFRLEELHLRISPVLLEDHHEREYYSFEEFEWGYDAIPNLLCDISRNKASRYPALKRVVSWQCEYFGHSPSLKELEYLNRDGTLEVRTTFKEADIDIYWYKSLEPPMYGKVSFSFQERFAMRL